MNKAYLFFALLFFLSNVVAQPTDKMISDVQSQNQSNAVPGDKQKIEAEYLEKARNNIELYRKGDVTVTIKEATGKPVKNAIIEINQVSQDFLFGNIVWEFAYLRDTDPPFKPEEFKSRFKGLFNFGIVPFYWEGYEYEPGKPRWYGNEEAISWCLENGITIKGHPLAWTSPAGTPKWLLKLPPEMATDLLKARIYENITGYKGKINMWDVVNEPVNTVPWDMALKDTANRDFIRYNVMGIPTGRIAPWVGKAYTWAHDANPGGHYILNEFFTLAIPAIRTRFYQLIKELMQDSIPVGGIGIQAHEPRDMWFSPVEMYKTFDLFSEFKMPIHITELHAQSSGKPITGWRQGIWTEEAQAEFAEQFYTLAYGHPSIASITWWGLSDRNSWLPGGGLLDKDYNPKPIYNRLSKLIREDWMTRNLSVKTDKNGIVSFRGFYGNYTIRLIQPDGTSRTYEAHLKKGEDNRWEFKVE